MTSTRGKGVHWVYRCFDAEGRLVYVGCTNNVPNRLATHRTSSWWSPTVVKVTTKVYPDGPTGREAERAAIRDEVPRWNKASKWVGRSKWTRDDWHDWILTLLHDGGLDSQLRNTLSHYASLFRSPLPDDLAARIVEAEERAEHARRESHRLDLERVAVQAARETEELRELNAELSDLMARQERLARALGIDWDDPELYNPEQAITDELARRGGEPR